MSCADCCASIPATHGNSGGFEGPEKHLELDFRSLCRSAPVSDGFLSTSDAEWSSVLEAARVCVLSIVSTPHVRMLLLSESSLFIYPTRIIIKTCGTTRLLLAIAPILAIAARVGLEPSFVAFHRRNYIFPEAQPAPHCNFPMEVKFLSDIFPMGRGFIVGPSNGPHSHWFSADVPATGATPCQSPVGSLALGVAPSPVGTAPSPTVAVNGFPSTEIGSPLELGSTWPQSDAGDARSDAAASSAWTFGPDAGRSATLTLEVMMTSVSPDVMAKFHRAAAQEDSSPNVAGRLLAVSAEGSPSVTALSPLDPTIRAADRWVVAASTPLIDDHGRIVGAGSDPVLVASGRAGETLVADATIDATYVERVKADATAPVFFQEPLDVINESRAMGAAITVATGIDTLMPNSVIDAYMFDPCGYSMNGVADGRFYWTIHITPEDHCSFVSFETCVPTRHYAAVVNRVVRLFKPGHAMVRIVAADGEGPSAAADLVRGLDADGYVVDNVTEMHATKNARLLAATISLNGANKSYPVELASEVCLPAKVAAPDVRPDILKLDVDADLERSPTSDVVARSSDEETIPTNLVVER